MMNEVTSCHCGKDLSGLNATNRDRHLKACKRKCPFKATSIKKKQSKITFASAPSVARSEFDFVIETPALTASASSSSSTANTELYASTPYEDLNLEEDPLPTPTTGTLDSSSTSSSSATNKETSTATSYTLLHKIKNVH